MKQHVYKYLKTSRRVGHTTLLKAGGENYNKPFFVVGGDINQARQLAKEMDNKNAIPISIKQPKNMLMYGDRIPILIDNYAYMRSCEGYEDSLRDERQRCSELNREHHREVVGMREDYKRYSLENTKQMLRLNDKLTETKKKLTYNEDIVQGMYDIDNYIITDFEKMSLWDRIFNYKKFCEEKYK